MIPRKQYAFKPDYHNIVQAARNQQADRLPLYEHCVGGKVIYDILGTNPYDLYSNDEKRSRRGFKELWEFYREMGFDAVPFDFSIVTILEGGGALVTPRDGCIKDRDDFRKYPWKDIPNRYYEHYARKYEYFADEQLPGMMAIGGVSNGLFEAVQDLTGYLNLCYIREDDEDLFTDLFKAMGEAEVKIWERFLRDFQDVFCVLRFPDDLGFKNQTMLPPNDIRKNIIPVYKEIIDMVHLSGKPFLLHTCGNVFAVMEDLISIAGIDAKHSNEDQIAPFSEWVERYGDRIGNFGGLDVDFLCRSTPEEIRKKTFACLDKIRGHGGIAFSSGSSVPDYMPAACYLAMVEAVRDWRGDQVIGMIEHNPTK